MEEALIDIKPVLTLNGGARADQSLKARIFNHPTKQDRCLVIAGDQDIGGFIAWDTEVGECIQKVGGIGSVFDIAQVNPVNSSTPAYIALTDKSLLYYTWRRDS